ncbi:hypothetical protein BXZ70DRAFT_908216 [Cristinia sonorae]|uniref:Uncharacterized protein n=1 Tax=Cristinia sonorae TaxID=1940300 RepID=A0A8K0UKN8_9AGAR|nr:hypothetical protein BXZ70DRAFT_908216 [Cristinia sonorae]
MIFCGVVQVVAKTAYYFSFRRALAPVYGLAGWLCGAIRTSKLVFLIFGVLYSSVFYNSLRRALSEQLQAEKADPCYRFNAYGDPFEVGVSGKQSASDSFVEDTKWLTNGTTMHPPAYLGASMKTLIIREGTIPERQDCVPTLGPVEIGTPGIRREGSVAFSLSYRCMLGCSDTADGGGFLLHLLAETSMHGSLKIHIRTAPDLNVSRRLYASRTKTVSVAPNRLSTVEFFSFPSNSTQEWRAGGIQGDISLLYNAHDVCLKKRALRAILPRRSEGSSWPTSDSTSAEHRTTLTPRIVLSAGKIYPLLV